MKQCKEYLRRTCKLLLVQCQVDQVLAWPGQAWRKHKLFSACPKPPLLLSPGKSHWNKICYLWSCYPPLPLLSCSWSLHQATLSLVQQTHFCLAVQYQWWWQQCKYGWVGMDQWTAGLRYWWEGELIVFVEQIVLDWGKLGWLWLEWSIHWHAFHWG